MSSCDGCAELAHDRRRTDTARVGWANELGNLACLLSLAEEADRWSTVERVRERLKELRREVGGGL